MLPIRDHNPSGRTPYVVYALMAANIGIFLMYWPILDDPYRIASFFNDWALIPSEVSSGRDQLGLFTSMFLHGGFMHLAGNMLFLWIFGDNMEDEMGHVGFALFYVLAGLAAGMAQVLSEPYSHIPTVGASGAIAGVMGGYLLLFPKARVDILLILVIFFKVFTIPAWIVLGLWFAFQVFNGLLVDAATSGVAHWAHAGGFVAGVVLTLPLWLRRGGTGFWARTAGHPPHPETHYDRSSIPVVRRIRK